MTLYGDPMRCPNGQRCMWGGDGGCFDDTCAYEELMKKAKSLPSVQYRDRPNGKERCRLCTMFRPPDRCTEVAGDIEPGGWCKLFAAKEGK